MKHENIKDSIIRLSVIIRNWDLLQEFSEANTHNPSRILKVDGLKIRPLWGLFENAEMYNINTELMNHLTNCYLKENYSIENVWELKYEYSNTHQYSNLNRLHMAIWFKHKLHDYINGKLK